MQSSSQIITTNKPTSSFFYSPSCCPTNSVKALKGKYHIPWTCLPHAHLGVFQLCLWPLIAPGYLGGGLPCLSSAPWCQCLKHYRDIITVTTFKSSRNCGTVPNADLHQDSTPLQAERIDCRQSVLCPEGPGMLGWCLDDLRSASWHTLYSTVLLCCVVYLVYLHLSQPSGSLLPERAVLRVNPGVVCSSYPTETEQPTIHTFYITALPATHSRDSLPLPRIMHKLSKGFSQNSVERWHMSHRRKR